MIFQSFANPIWFDDSEGYETGGDEIGEKEAQGAP